jgi:hypothetical protein
MAATVLSRCRDGGNRFEIVFWHKMRITEFLCIILFGIPKFGIRIQICQFFNSGIQKKIRPESLELKTESEFHFRWRSQKSETKIGIPNQVVIDNTDNATQCKRATLLAINICACPMHPNEPIPHKDMVAWNKLQAEAGLEKRKTALGWLLDTRQLLVQLPKNKFIAWTNLINTIIQRGTTMAKEVESIIG